MTPPKKLPFAPVLRSVLAEDGRAVAHPEIDALIAHRAGRLPPEETDRVEKHLRSCSECAELLRDLDTFEAFTPAPAAEAMTDRGGDAAWERMSARLPGKAVGVGDSKGMRLVPPLASTEQKIVWWRRPEPAYAMAAALLLCVIGLAAQGRSLTQRIHSLSQPAVNVPIRDLLTSRGSAPLPLIPTGADRFVLLIHPPRNAGSSEYRAEIHSLTSSGEPILRIAGLRSSEEEHLSMEVSSSSLPAGNYRLDLYKAGDSSSPVASYEFVVGSL